METKPLTDITEDELREAIKHTMNTTLTECSFEGVIALLDKALNRIRERREGDLVGVGDVIEYRGSYPEDPVVGVVIRVRPGAGKTGKDLLDYTMVDPGYRHKYLERWHKVCGQNCEQYYTPDGRRVTGVKVEE